MEYKIQITKVSKNENFKEEMKQWKEDNRYAGYSSTSRPMPQLEVIDNVLLVQITEEQFKKIKEEVMKVF